MLDENVRIRSQWNRVWESLEFEDHLKTIPYTGLIPIFQQHFKPQDLVLEGGCGLGKLVVFLSERGYQIIGVDHNLGPLQKIQSYYPQARIVQGDIFKLCLPDQCLDAYISIGVIEHFIDGPAIALAETRRVLRPGAKLIVSVPCKNELRRVLYPLTEPFLRLRHWIRTKPRLRKILGKRLLRPDELEFFYQYYFTADDLGAVLREAGFQPETFYAMEQELGLYRDSGIFKLLIGKPGGKGRGGYPILTGCGKWLCNFLNRHTPYATNHMVVCVAVKI